jgi:hypothetical protein
VKRTWAEIVEVTEMRRSDNATLLNEMIAVRNRYNGDVVIPLGDTDTEPNLPPITPSLVSESIDNVALRAASVMPSIDVPALNPAKQSGVRSRDYAQSRRHVYYGTWYSSALPILLRRAYRHLSGYASTTLIVVPDHERCMPIVELRDPLGTYPEPKASEDLSPPRDCAMVYERSASWIRACYPAARRELGGPVGRPGSDAEMWDLVEWVDEYHTCIGVLGPRDPQDSSARDVLDAKAYPTFQLSAWENRAGVPPLITAQRVTLDRIASQVANNVGMIDLLTRIMALALLAEEKAVFPDRFVLARPGEAARIITNGGQWVDGRTGQTNILDGVANVGQLDSAPPQSTYQMADRIERSYRVSTGLVPQFGGETYGSLRTGRGMDAMMGVAVDPKVQELQDVMAFGLSHLNGIIGAMWKGYWGGDKIQLISGWGGKSKVVEFVPDQIMETPANVVAYAIPGADVQSVTIQLGQLLGADAISLRTFREKHPWIGDPDDEANSVDEEKLERAVFEAVVSQTASGSLPLTYLAKLERHRKSTGDIFEAIEAANVEVQEEQAAIPPAPPAGMGAPPEIMPGLAAGPEQMAGVTQDPNAQPALEAPIAPTEGQQGLSSLVNALKAG